MQLDFRELQLLLGPFRPTINIRQGQGIRSWIEKNTRGVKKKTKDFQKRANTYVDGAMWMRKYALPKDPVD